MPYMHPAAPLKFHVIMVYIYIYIYTEECPTLIYPCRRAYREVMM